MFLQQKELTKIIITAFIMLLIPVTAMQFTDQVNWKTLDFVVLFFIVLIVGILIKIVCNSISKKRNKIIIIAIIISITLLIWAELAVGIFGTPLAGN
jgi:hypothetical protein